MLAESRSNTTNGAKDILLPMFYKRAVQDHLASENEGRPIFREEVYVQIHIPGDKNTVIDRKLREEDKKRWLLQWEAFISNSSQAVEGTPLEQWPALSVSQIAELKALHIPTIEILADLPESGLQRIGMGARELQARAKAFLQAAKGNSSLEKIAAENSRLNEMIQQLTQSNADLGEKIKDLEASIEKKSSIESRKRK